MTDSLPALSETIIREAADAIVYADAEGAIRFWNAAAERIFGYAATEAIGQSLDIIIPEKLRGRHWEGYRQVMQTGQSRYGAGDLLAVPAQRKDGTRISVEFTIVPRARRRRPDARHGGDPARRDEALQRDESPQGAAGRDKAGGATIGRPEHG